VAIGLLVLGGALALVTRLPRRVRRGGPGAVLPDDERTGAVDTVTAPPTVDPPPGPPVLDEAAREQAGLGDDALEQAALATPPPDDAGLETPMPSAGRLVRLRGRLARSQNALGRGLLSALSRDRLDEAVWEEVEEILLTADMGVAASAELVASLRDRTRVLGVRTPEQLRSLLRDELLAQVGTTMERGLDTEPRDGLPAVVLMVGVNGTGKTTTCGKLARSLVGDGRTVVLGAADTFRAAAADQLATWGERVGASVVRGPEGGDPASVAFDAVRTGISAGADTVVVDTAGRLHTKTGLMDELAKMKRVVEKQAPVRETLLVLDATTGQNGVVQARVFTEAVEVTGIVLTKLDGTAKGGIVVAVQRSLGIPVKLVGLGEGPDDLAPFDPEVFVDALIGQPEDSARP
jgi:fused signal recognition particle receptor